MWCCVTGPQRLYHGKQASLIFAAGYGLRRPYHGRTKVTTLVSIFATGDAKDARETEGLVTESAADNSALTRQLCLLRSARNI
jgi:hypothetical protein